MPGPSDPASRNPNSENPEGYARITAISPAASRATHVDETQQALTIRHADLRRQLPDQKTHARQILAGVCRVAISNRLRVSAYRVESSTSSATGTITGLA
jgi:hypothetical protein